jgi:hypothetical protein
MTERKPLTEAQKDALATATLMAQRGLGFTIEAERVADRMVLRRAGRVRPPGEGRGCGGRLRPLRRDDRRPRDHLGTSGRAGEAQLMGV